VPLLAGEVTALETEVSGSGVHTVVRGLDLSHRLFRGRRVEAYLNATAADIARTVAERAGIPAGRIDVRGPVLAHVAQDGVNDWEFLRGLAEQTGAVLAVVDGALDFRGPTEATEAPHGSSGARQDPLVIERGVNLVSLRATITSAGQVPEVEVRGWDVTAKRSWSASPRRAPRARCSTRSTPPASPPRSPAPATSCPRRRSVSSPSATPPRLRCPTTCRRLRRARRRGAGNPRVRPGPPWPC
jgi:phage protein D